MKNKRKVNPYVELEDKACELLADKNAALKVDYSLGQWDSWAMDQENGRLLFTLDEVPQVSCRIQFIGSYSTKSNTWMWGWYNKSIPEHLKVDAAKVLKYGEEHQFEILMRYGGPCDEEQAWRFAAVALYINGGEGVYGAQFPGGRSLLLLKELQWVNGERNSEE